ncbi:MAG: hypothetical protein OQJ89_01615, partial [Kangiellaceae bacterium]|nr:hypothetical protein [Kangiellaceae bacterium]
MSQKISIASGQASFQEKLAILKSENLLDNFIEQYNLKPLLFPKRWDNANQKWIKPEPGIIKIIFEWVAFQPSDISKSRRKNFEPKDHKAFKRLSNKLKIKLNKKNGLISVSLKWQNPAIGTEIVEDFITYANDFVLQKEQDDINSEIKNIEQLLKKEKRAVNIKLLLEQIEQRKIRLSTLASPLSQP